MLTTTTLGVLTTLFLTTQAAHGDIVTVEVAGTVTNVIRTDPNRFDLDGSVSAGSPYQMTFVINTDAIDADPDPGRGTYFIVAASGQLGNYIWSKTQAPVFGIEIDNDRVGVVDEYELGSQDFDFTENFLIDGTPTLLSNNAFEFVLAGINLSDPSMVALDSDALVLPLLNDWGSTSFGMRFISDENAVGFLEIVFIHGTVDSITVPEPVGIT